MTTHSSSTTGRPGTAVAERASSNRNAMARLSAAQDAHDTAYETFRGAVVDAGFQQNAATTRAYQQYATAREQFRAARQAVGVHDATRVNQQQAIEAIQRQHAASGAGAKRGSDAQRLNATLAYEERAIARQPNEHAAALRPNGTNLFHVSGTHAAVAFSDAHLAALRGGVMTHNHPGGQSFSDVDVEFAKRNSLAEIRVSTPGSRYSLKPPQAGWSSVSIRTIQSALRSAQQSVMREQDRLARTASPAKLARLNQNYWHEVMTRVAAQTGIQYSRSRWPK